MPTRRSHPAIRLVLGLLAVIGGFCFPPSATSTLIPPNHVTCYTITTTRRFFILNPPGVTLGDQFSPSRVAVKKQTRLCAPTRKNSDPPPTAPDEHFEMYQVKPGVKFTKVLDRVFTDAFGTLHLDVLKPAEIMLPTETSVFAPPPLTPTVNDHFQCYKVKDRKIPAKFQPVVVTLTDQFQAMQVEVKKPIRLCAPVNKNNEDPTAPNHFDHLVCYRIKDLKQPAFAPVGPIFVDNQFGEETLDVRKPAELCVPALERP